MLEVMDLLELSKRVATQAGLRLLASSSQYHKLYVHCLDHPKEVKSMADSFLEQDILKAIGPTGLAILSEESGYIRADKESPYYFVIDPLDGTFNFVKGLGPSAISIALWHDRKPIFGVIYNLSERQLSWGGRDLGAYCDGQPISVSDTSTKAQASICTGFPVRFDLTSDSEALNFWHLIKPFAKVRMFGSAAISLLHIANGSADVYSEKNIMLWDVAAGLAIVEGAGGGYFLNEIGNDWSCSVSASNARLLPDCVDFIQS